jgi:alpha-tubulin suppressor-like RCC1 family protein
MKTLPKLLLILAALCLAAAAGCKPVDLSLQCNRIFLMGRLIEGQSCTVRVIWRKAPADAAPSMVTADLSQIGGNADEALSAGENGTWQWAGQVTPTASGESLITITARGGQGQEQEISKRFRVFKPGKAIAIAAGVMFMALKADGTVVEWNYNYYGSQPAVPAGLTNIVAIAAGLPQRLALKADGTVTAWGCDNSSDYSYSTTGLCDVPEGLSGVVAIAANQWGSYAIQADGAVKAWGQYGYAPASLADVISIAGEISGGAALQADGTVTTWPKKATMQHAAAISFKANQLKVFVLKSDGRIMKLDAGEDSSYYYQEISLPLRMRTVRASAISSGQDSSIALQPNGSVVVWRESSYYKRLNNIIAVAAGSYYGDNFMTLAEDGSVYAWAEPWVRDPVTEISVPAELQ